MLRNSAPYRLIRAELDYAEQVLAAWQVRVQELRDALEELPDVLDAKRKTAVKGRRLRDAGVVIRAQNTSLPKTGAEFWLRHIGKRRRSSAQIVNAAVAYLKLDAERDKEAIRILKSRVGPSVERLVKAGVIKDIGSGRARRFFKTSS